jgi:hypothetical protein
MASLYVHERSPEVERILVLRILGRLLEPDARRGHRLAVAWPSR